MQSSPKDPTIDPANRLLIVDGHSYAYRAFFAIRRLTSPDGTATNAIYGFIRMLAKVQAMIRPSHAIVIWDGGLAPERMALLPEYKAQRVEMPHDLEKQLDQIVAYLNAARISSFMKEGTEADDCIAAMARKAVEAGMGVVIASSDKDFMQLVSPQVALLNPNDKSEKIWGIEQVKLKAGVEPTQIVDWLSLVGDTVDNIPGVSGVGPKTASELLRQFGSVDELYRRISEVPSDRLRTNLQGAAELVLRNQKLVRLNEKAPCDWPLPDLAMKTVNYDALHELYSKWGFKTLLQELEQAHLKTSDLFQ